MLATVGTERKMLTAEQNEFITHTGPRVGLPRKMAPQMVDNS
jgi:hypothetical protein